MKVDSVGLSFGAGFRYKNGTTTAQKILQDSAPAARASLKRQVPEIKEQGPNGRVNHLVDFATEAAFSIQTVIKKTANDLKEALHITAPEVAPDKLAQQAKKNYDSLELALQHNLSQDEVDAVGPEKMKEYVDLKKLQTSLS